MTILDRLEAWLTVYLSDFYAMAITAWVILGLGFLVFMICFHFHKHMQITLILSVTLSATALFCPMIFGEHSQNSAWMNFLTAGLKAVRLFLLEEDFGEFLKDLASYKLTNPVDDWYQNTAICLYVLAPVFAITTIASFVRNFSSGVSKAVRGLLVRLYAFSELNEKSLALAADIRKKDGFATIAFYDVYRKNEEKNTELIKRANELRALCFSNDILHMHLFPYWRMKEFFIIGEQESECLNQAIQLTNKYHKRRKIKVYVWAQSPESEAVLDSLQKNRKEKNGFVLRRIHDAQIFAWNLLQEAELFRVDKEQRRKSLSILLVGMGLYGKEILKTALWMYQIDDMQLQINVVDASDTVESSLRHECPELLEMNENKIPGEAHYSIRFFENTNIFRGGLENILFSDDPQLQEQKQRLNGTDVIFVTLGDDDTNIRAAMELRTMFDRVHYLERFEQLKGEAIANGEDPADDPKKFSEIFCEREKDAKLPRIYTPVYDAVKAENITLTPATDKRRKKQQPSNGLCCPRGIPYHIGFKGSFKEQYAYDTITRRTLEAEALQYHLHWSGTDAKRKEDKRMYEQYEYFRRSSMAQAIHKAMITDVLQLKCEKRSGVPAGVENPDKSNCPCKNCTRIREIEHMRWNAYMRTEGYCAPKTGSDYKVKLERAKLHVNLLAFRELNTEEENKDSTVAT